MGSYLNPGNSGFAGIRNIVYVDKSGLISLVNQTIGTPRRFGKSFAARIYSENTWNFCALCSKTAK